MKKVLYLITKGSWGGAQRYVYDLATNTPDDLVPSVALGNTGALEEALEEAGIETHILRNAQRDIYVLKEVALFIEVFWLIFKKQPEVLHVNSSKLGGIGAFAGRLLGVPHIIFTVHGWPFNETHRSKVWRKLVYFFSWLTTLFAHTTITLSERDFATSKHFMFSSGKIIHMPLGVSPGKLHSRDKARLALGKNIPSGGFWIGTIAELHPNKGLMYGLHALAIMKDEHEFNYVIIGEGEERNSLEETINSTGLSGRAHMPGFIPDAQQFLLAFDLLLFPSLKEGLPYVILEAAMAEIPVVGSNVGGIPDLLPSSDHLARPADVEELGDRIRRMIEQKEIRLQAGKGLRAHVIKNFPLERMLERTFKLYRER